MATYYIPSSAGWSTGNKYVFYRVYIEESVYNGNRTVKATLQAMKSSSSTDITSGRGTAYLRIGNANCDKPMVYMSDIFHNDNVWRDYASGIAYPSVGTSSITIGAGFDFTNSAIHAEGYNTYTISLLSATAKISFDVTNQSSITRYIGGTYSLSNIIPKKEGYNFNGWYKSDGTKINDNDIVTENITLYARWLPEEYTINLITNSPTIQNKKIKVSYNQDLNNFNSDIVLTKPGYSFEGYFTDTEEQVYDKNGLWVKGNYWKNGLWVKDLGDNNSILSLRAKWKEQNIAFVKDKDNIWKKTLTFYKTEDKWEPAILYIKDNYSWNRSIL